MSIYYGEIMPKVPELVLVTPLGDNNDGTIGPNGQPDDNAALTAHMATEVGRAEYSKPPTNRWVCVDGRVTAAKMKETERLNADPQTAGGLPLTELSVDFMLHDNPKPVSVTLAATTKKTIDNKQQAIVHGDEHVHFDGCGCNVKQREILQRNAANIDIVTPIAWTFAEKLGIDKYLEIDDVTKMVVTGEKNAENDELWDATPAEKVQIILDNGGEYEEFIADHTELITRADISNAAFDEAAFIRDHTDEDGNALRAFSASFGALKAYYFEVAEKNGTSVHDAALRTVAAILHNLGTAKRLSNKNMHAGIYA